MIPGRGFFLILALWVLSALLVVLWPQIGFLWTGSGLALLAIAWVDLRACAERAAPSVQRRVAGSLPVGVWTEITLRFGTPDGNELKAAVFDHHPAGDDVLGLPASVTVAGSGWAELRYQYRPRTRGDRHFEAVELLVESPMRIWRKRVRGANADVVRVYPNFAEVSKYALLATGHRLSQMGIRKQARRGEGTEFHQLREYHAGDSMRQIDWKATLRMRKIISREYQEERDQQIMLLIDCGRRMSAHDGALSHFDHSLNSALLLAHVALRQGDLVGLQTFGGTDRFLAPSRGPGTLRAFLNCVYDVQPSIRSADYLRVARETIARVRKRSLIILMTNLRDEDVSEIIPAVQLLRRRHLVLLASLREPVVGEVLRSPVHRFRDALTVAAVHKYLLGRRRTLDTIRRYGVITLDVEADRLPIGMVNRYLDIKQSGVL